MSPKDLPALANSSDVEVVFEVQTLPADKVTVVVDLQSEEGYLAGETVHAVATKSILVVCIHPVDFIIPDQQPTSPSVKVQVGRDGTPADNQKLSMIVKR